MATTGKSTGDIKSDNSTTTDVGAVSEDAYITSTLSLSQRIAKLEGVSVSEDLFTVVYWALFCQWRSWGRRRWGRFYRTPEKALDWWLEFNKWGSINEGEEKSMGKKPKSRQLRLYQMTKFLESKGKGIWPSDFVEYKPGISLCLEQRATALIEKCNSYRDTLLENGYWTQSQYDAIITFLDDF